MSTCIDKIECTDNQFHVTRFYVMLKHTITYPMYPNLHKRKETVVLSLKERSVYNLESNIFIFYFFNVTIISPTLHRVTEGSRLCFRTATEIFHVHDYSRSSHRTWMCTKVTSSSEKETRIN